MKKKKTLDARLNHGRWIVDCPNCAGAEFAVAGRPFVCMGEWIPRAIAAGAVGPDAIWAKAHELATEAGDTYPVAFPDDQAEIDRIVSTRNPENQNWYPGETLDDLRQENKEHGVKTPRSRKAST